MMQSIHFAFPRYLAALALVALLAGCGGGPKTVKVSGAVTYEGQPVELGEISFVPEEPGEAPAGGVIQEGRYAVDLKPGRKTVRIRGSRPLPPERQDSPEMGTRYEDFIPARYNTESTLTEEITASGQRDFHLPLP